MAIKSLQHRTGDELLEQHLKLQSMLEDLHQMFVSKTTAQGLGQELTELREHIQSHFAFEEEGGYLHTALAGAVHLNDAAGELLKQHTTLLQQLDRLIDRAKQENEGSVMNAELAVELGDFLRRFQDHERKEDELIQRAIDEEIFAAD